MTGRQVGETRDDFVVAAHGWRHPAWQDDYYPADLPADWQLSFYSNEFRAVVVPANYWPQVDALEVARWREDTGGEFRFFLEVADLRADWEAFLALVSPLANQLGGILLRPTHCDADLSQLTLSLQRAQQLAPVTVTLPPGQELSDEGRCLLLDNGIGLPWLAGQDRPRWTPSSLALIHTNETRRAPREWRDVVEDCLAYGVDSDTVLLMMEGEAPDVEALRVTTMIADMLPAARALR